MRKLVAISIITSTLMLSPPAHADDSATTTTYPPTKEQKAKLEYWYQSNDPRTPPSRYWDALAKCETGNNWQNKGQWSGGLGIYQRTWYEFGGYDYAKHPWQASYVQQLVIANRISLFGYKWKNRYRTWDDKVAGRGMVKYPVRYFGWGCARETTGNPCGRLPDGSKGYFRPSRAWVSRNCTN